MGYGDFQFYDIVIFALIAIFLVFRLRNVLGKRTGFERSVREKSEGLDKNLKSETKANIVPELEENFVELKKAYIAINNFDHNNFLDGAKNAFETIINSFNKGDKKTLKTLLSENVYGVFEKAIDEKNVDPSSQIFSLKISKVEKVVIDNNKIAISVIFISEHFKNNDETTIVKKEDTWTFEKDALSKNPNWLLSST